MYLQYNKSYLIWTYYYLLVLLVLFSNFSCAQHDSFYNGIWTPDFLQFESNTYREDAFDDQPSAYEQELNRNIRIREQVQLDALRRAINAEQYGENTLSDSRIGRVRRTSVGLQKSKFPANWQILVGITSASLVIVVVVGGMFFYQRKKRTKRGSTDDIDFGGLRLDKPSPTSSLLSDTQLDGDRKLAHSAQMYHYQHQKQQMLAVEKAGDNLRTDETSGTDDEVGDHTVYECPGFAETSQLEVENPLYAEELANENREHDEVISDSTPTSKNIVEP